MNDAVKLLSDRGITFSKGFYTTTFQLAKKKFEPEGLLSLYQGKIENDNLTVNDTHIPTKLLERWDKNPRTTVQSIQENVRDIYIDKRIEALTQQSNLIKKGERNVKEIMRSMLKNKIPVPEGFSVEGVDLVLKEGLGASVAFECRSEKDYLVKRRKEFRKHLQPESIDKILAIELASIADKWKYKRL